MIREELALKTEKELHTLLVELRDDLRARRFDRASAQLKNVRAIRKTRKDIAQILTFLRHKKQS